MQPIVLASHTHPMHGPGMVVCFIVLGILWLGTIAIVIHEEKTDSYQSGYNAGMHEHETKSNSSD